MKKELAIITVIGRDQIGIVAHVSRVLYENQINIEDMSQSIMEGFFVMGMLVDVGRSPKNIKEIRQQLNETGEKVGLSITIQHEDIFNAMHRV